MHSLRLYCISQHVGFLQIGRNKAMSAIGRDRNLAKSDCLIALVTKDYLADRRCWEEMEQAFQEKKPMYAIVSRGAAFSRVKHYPWKAVRYWTNGDDDEFERVSEELLLLVQAEGATDRK